MSHAQNLGNLRDDVVNDYIEQLIATEVQNALVEKNREIERLEHDLVEANGKAEEAQSELGGRVQELEELRGDLVKVEGELAGLKRESREP